MGFHQDLKWFTLGVALVFTLIQTTNAWGLADCPGKNPFNHCIFYKCYLIDIIIIIVIIMRIIVMMLVIALTVIIIIILIVITG